MDLNLLDSLSFYLRKLCCFPKAQTLLSQDKVLTQCQAVVSQFAVIIHVFCSPPVASFHVSLPALCCCVGLDCSVVRRLRPPCALETIQSRFEERRKHIRLFSASMPRNAGFAQTCVEARWRSSYVTACDSSRFVMTSVPCLPSQDGLVQTAALREGFQRLVHQDRHQKGSQVSDGRMSAPQLQECDSAGWKVPGVESACASLKRLQTYFKSVLVFLKSTKEV